MKTVIKRTITALILGSIFWLAMIYLSPFQLTLVFLTILLQIIFFEWSNLFDIRKPSFWLVMPLYPILPFALLILLNHDPAYRQLLLILFIIVSSHDTGSYIIGNLIGKHPILPKISPGKTWEGFFGGLICAMVGLWFVLWEMGTMKSLLIIAPFCLITCSLSLMGDLFESFLKRRAHIKDSGNVLPGHGGFLDRFDGILFTTFFFYLLRAQISQLLL